MLDTMISIMNYGFMIFKMSLLLLIVIIGLTLSGCESDPILSPQVEAEDDGGSYGNTNLPVNTTGNTENAGNDQLHQKKTQNIKKTQNRDNPKLF